MNLNLETVLTSPKFFGLTKATATQRAICRVIEGRALGELARDPDVVEALGGSEACAILAPGSFRPREVDLLCAIRGAKSIIVAAHALWTSQTIDLRSTRDGDTIRHAVLSVNLASAAATFNHLAGTMMARPLLRPLLVADPIDGRLLIRHPSGRTIEVVTVAGARAGQNLVSVWLTGVAFEEYSRQAGEASGSTVNYEDQRDAAEGRVLEGGHVLSVGSPWAPFGPAFERHAAYFGRPTPERVIIKATGPQMNPSWWTPARCDALRRSNPAAYITDVLAGFADRATSLIPSADLDKATRAEPMMLEPFAGCSYSAAMDPATRGNSWPLVIVEHEERGDGETKRCRVAFAKQWQGSPSSPLHPDEVLAEIAEILRAYRLDSVWTDQLASDFVCDIARRHGLTVEVETTTAANKVEMYESLRARISDGAVELSPDPAIRSDLLSLRRVVTRNGVAIDLPRTADGRHADYAPALALAVSKGGESTVSWVQAMQTWRADQDGSPKPPLIVTTDYASAETEAIGNPPKFTRAERAKWSTVKPFDPVRYSPAATAAFRSAVEAHRHKQGNQS